jgi:hypothetical protein
MQQFYHSGPSYLLHLRAALAMAVRHCIPGARACYEYIQHELRVTTMPHFRRTGQARFSIDPDNDHQGLWWNAPAGSEAGWGISFAQQEDVIFATWFTYNYEGAAWWVSMTAERIAARTYAGTIYETSGPSYTEPAFDPGAVSASAVGTGTLTFHDSDSGVFEYTVNGTSQKKSITRQVFADPMPVCTTRDGEEFSQTTNFQDIWWNFPPGSEAGWGISIAHQGDVIFAVWFTYDSDRTPMWLSLTARKTAPSMFAGSLYRTAVPAFNANPFDPSRIAAAPVGSASLSFLDSTNATFTYSIGSVSGNKSITRQIFRPPGTVCT